MGEDDIIPEDLIDSDIKSFFTNDLPSLDEDNKQLLRHSINIIRERIKDKDKYQAG
jgi:hypothetical protein